MADSLKGGAVAGTQDQEEVYWVVKGTIRYTTADGRQDTYSVIMRNVSGRNKQQASGFVLHGFADFILATKGVEITDAGWESEPQVSSFDPHFDR